LFQCPRQHHLSFEQGLQPKKKKIYFDEGTAAHNAMQTIYSGGTVDEAIASFDKVYEGHIAGLEKYPAEKDKAISKFLATRALVLVYLETIVPDDMKKYDTSHVEEEFTVPILDMDGKAIPDVMFAGKMDGIWTEREGSKASMVVEHKFYASFNEVENTLYLDQQVTLYALAAALAFGIKVPVTLYNVARKPRNERQKDESPDEFFYRIYELVSDPKNRKSYFSRVPITRGYQHFRVAHEILFNAAMIITGKAPLPYTYRNVGDHCLWLCPFKSICLEQDPRTTEQMFEKKPKLHPELEIVES
jgi:hypothetical protein